MGDLHKRERWSSQSHNPTNHSEVLKPVLQCRVDVIFDHLKYWVSGDGHHSKENSRKLGKCGNFSHDLICKYLIL